MFDGIKRQLRSVIEWRDPLPDALFEQWTDNGDEIKNASKLIVGPGQGCIFVYEGRVKAVLTEPCLFELKTANIPFWTTIKKFMQFFESEHKVAIYFFKTAKVLDQKWGTASVIKYEDPKFQFPVGLKAFGNYSYRIQDPEHFFANVVGHKNGFFVDDFRQIMSARLIHPIADYLAENKFSVTEIDANREEIERGLRIKLAIAFKKLGFEISDFRIEGTDFDEETVSRINRISDLSADAYAAKIAGLDYTQLQKLEAMRDAAKNEGGGAGIGMGLGAGIGFGQNMAQVITSENKDTTADKLLKLKELFEAGLIDATEYSAKKKQILDQF